jgi:hypothetical protein
MKYYDNLPKISFESTIGSFSISDFFTYIDPYNITFEKTNVELDDRTTLVEASNRIYDNPDSFWLFVLANNKINPFKISPPNATVFKKNEAGKFSVGFAGDLSGTTSYVFPKGSIILQYTANSGNSASFSSVGNFNIEGAFTLIEDEFYSSDSMITKKQKNGTILTEGTTGGSYVVIYPNDGGSYGIQKLLYSSSIVPSTSRTLTLFNSTTGKYVNQTKLTGNAPPKGFDAASLEPVLIGSGNTSSTDIATLEDYLNSSSKEIKAFDKSVTGRIKSLFVTAKYI